MKRVKAACILQTLVFTQKPQFGFSKEKTLEVNHEEFERYEAALKKARVRYQIDETTEEADGSLVVRIRKQYNDKANVSEYFK